MKIKNELNLPLPLVRVHEKDPYKKEGHYSATELAVPFQIHELRRRYEDQIEVDASDLIYALLGNNMHYLLQLADIDNALTEERLSTQVGLWTVSGKPDLYYDRVIWDYKMSTRWTLIDGVKPDWESQLNVNRLIMMDNDFNVDALKICCMFRDWSKIQAMKVPDYPKHQVHVFDVDVWKYNYTYEWILNRINGHELSKEFDDTELPECSPEERWEKPTKYAVMKGKNKRATKLFDDEKEAEEMAGTDELYHVVKRPGESTRCGFYCDVKDFCQQYKRMKGE